jgi:tetratricopeptide (TPR) repeat protein
MYEAFEEFKQKVKGQEFQAVILFADIMNASEISNNTSIENYAYIINQFHKCAADVYEFIGLNNFQNKIVELTLRGDEVWLILRSAPLEKVGSPKEKIEMALARDVRDAIRFGIAMKLLWRATEYNRDRIIEDIFPRDLGIGIHQGPVYFYKDKELPSSLDKKESSEGYSINLAKRIETESRNGEKSEILVSGSIKYWSEKIKIRLDFQKQIPKDKLKGLSTNFSIYEIINVKDDFANLIDKLIKELKFDDETWEKYELLKEKNPDDFWAELLVRFKTKVKEEQKPEFIENKPGKEITEKGYEFYLLEAEKFYDMGNYDKVIENLTKAIELNPNEAAAYNNRGNTYSDKKEYDKAIADYNEAIELNPNYAAAYNNRGSAYYDKTEYDKAIADCNKAIELDPKYATAYNNRGNAYRNKKKYDHAIADYNKAIELNPKDAAAYNNRGNTYSDKKEYDKAIADYNKAIELDLKYVVAYYNRGSAYYDQKEYDKAIADYNKAIEFNPKDAAAYNNRGSAYCNKKEYDKAIADYNKAIELNPKDAGAYNNRGNAYSDKKEYDQAIADYNKAIELDLKYVAAYNNRGSTYYDKKEYDQAIADYNKAIELDPKYAAAYCNRGNAYSYKKEYDQAIVDYNKAIELDPKYAAAYCNRGNAYSDKKEYGQAIADYNKGIELDLNPAAVYSCHGWTCLFLNEWEKAKSDFEKAIELDSNSPYPYGNLGIYYWKAKNDKSKALEYYEKCFQKGFKEWDDLYSEKSDGHFISDLNQTPEFKALVEKYKK